MSELGFTPKHLLVANSIREEILSGRLQVGERLKPDTELAQQYGINKRTVANGMAELVKEGLISRAPKRGSLVISATGSGKEKRSNAVGIIASNYGHLYEEMSRIMNDALLEHGLYPVWINHKLFTDAINEPDNPAVVRLLERLMADKPYGFIIDADRFMPFDYLAAHLEQCGKLVFMFHYLFPRRLPGAYVLTDFSALGCSMAGELLRRGHRRIAYLTAPQPLRDGYCETPHEIVCHAMRECCAQAGAVFVDEAAERCFNGEPLEAILESLRDRKLLPTGAGTHSDSFCFHQILPAAARLGISVPRELALIGVGDTPWSRKTVPALSSMNLRHEELAKRAVEQLFSADIGSELITPAFVERESTRTPSQ